MKVLAIGDVFGKTGRQIIKNYLPELKEKYQIDFVVANVENATHGKGISKKHYEELKFTKSKEGQEKKILIDVMTSGNHIFHQEETQKFIGALPDLDLLRPLNSSPFHPGPGTIQVNIKNKKIRVTNLIGVTFMPPAENPYFILEKLLEDDDSDIHLVDFHAEATAEKIAFAYYFDNKFPGKITAMWGTHTHVQTADERILPSHKTAFITDLGMTGPTRGIIGAQPEGIIQRTKYGLPTRILPHEDNGQFNGVIWEIDDISNEVIKIERIFKIF
jgi:hypothetical protein